MEDDIKIKMEKDGLPVLGQLSPMDLRKVLSREDRIFTPWLAKQESTNMLADELGPPPLEKHGMETAVGRSSADLVCRITNTDD